MVLKIISWSPRFSRSWTLYSPGAVGLVPRLAGKIAVFDGGAVHQMLAAAAAVHRGPEIVQHMAVEADPLARRKPDDPDADLVGLRQQLAADAAVVLAAFALELGLELGRPFAAVFGDRLLVQHGQSHGIPPTDLLAQYRAFAGGPACRTDRGKRSGAVVIGGSMSGLFAGLQLRARGFAVDIYERVDSELSGRGAGIVAQPVVPTAHAGARHRHRRSRRRDDDPENPRRRRPRRRRGALPADADRLGAALSHPARCLSGGALSPRHRLEGLRAERPRR